jgi:hypothetical protein
MMAMLDLFEERVQFASQSLGEAEPEDLGDLVGGQAHQPEIAGAFKQFVDGQVAAKDQVAAVLDLLEGVVATEVDRGLVAPLEK